MPLPYQQGFTQGYGKDPLAAQPYDPTGWLAGAVPTAAGSTTPAAASFSNPYGTGGRNNDNLDKGIFWAEPGAGMDNALSNMGISINNNSTFANTMRDLAGGFKWASLLGGNGLEAPANWMGDLQKFVGTDQGGQGTGWSLGNINSLMGNLMSGAAGDPFIESLIDGKTPGEFNDIAVSIINSLGFGNVAPEAIQGLSSLLDNAERKWASMGADARGALGGDMSDMDYYRQMLLGGEFGDFLSVFGL